MSVAMDLLQMADAVVLLPGWEKSTGCNRELGYAMATDKLILDYATILEGGDQNGAI